MYPQTESLKYNWKQTAASPGLLSSGESSPGVGSAPRDCRVGPGQQSSFQEESRAGIWLKTP